MREEMEMLEPCPVCAGSGYLLGVSGVVEYYRCRACGSDFSVAPEGEPGVLETRKICDDCG